MLVVHRAERADDLADALATLLTEPLTDPFAAEVVAVPTRGMERWLTQRMSVVLGASAGRHDGVCANVEFPFPHRLVNDAVAAASGVDPEADPWLPERASWPLLEVVQECLQQPWLAALARYLGGAGERPDPVRRARRLSAVRHLAALFDSYAMHRPEMIEAWGRGEDSDARGAALPGGARWQAELWRRLRARIALPGPAERRQRACDRLRQDPSLVALPRRFALFGLTRLPAGQLRVLAALAEGRDAHLFLLHPSPSLWDEIAGMDMASVRTLSRSDDPTAELPANRLLASWGRDARELQLVLAAAADHTGPGGDRADNRAGADHHHGTPPAGKTLLARIQAGVRLDLAPPGAPLPNHADDRPLLAADDNSIEIHSCHGRLRQVEVARDAILHALADDPTLEPRDLIVMCPDIETFAPLIEATFGAGELSAQDDGDGLAGHPQPVDLRVRLADRSLRQTNPVLAVVSQLLELAEQRITASQVLDLADRGPVRRRFGFDDDDLGKLQDWIAQAGIRWGLDAAHRSPYKLEQVPSGTWRDGLDRILLGAAMTEEGQRLFERVLPLDDVDSRSIDLAGRLAELIERLGDAVDSLSRPQTLTDWAAAIGHAADALTDTSPLDRWQRAELQRVLNDLVEEAADRAAGSAAPELAPAEVRAHLAHRLQGRPTRANFRTGHLTVCTLMPMRSVPHRVVCLLGLDDAAFPRKAPRDGDDLLLEDPHLGERDPRSEDRQLLLDALLAATERLIVTYTGNDERTNTPRPAAVPVGELLDTAEATVRTACGDVRGQIVVRHPLQPFDPRNFSAGSLVKGRRWSFDPVTLDGAVALAGPRAQPPPFLAAPLPPRRLAVIELDDLVRFVEHPVRAFLRQRLGLGLWGGSDEIEDALVVELDGLRRWGVGQRLLDARLAGVDGTTAIRAEIARGTLPPGVLGKPVIETVYPVVDAIVAEAAALTSGRPASDPADVRVALENGRALSGTVSGLHGDVLLATTYSRVSARHRLAAWVRLLALTAADPEREFSAATVGRAGGGDDVRVAAIAALADDGAGRRAAALEHLAAVIELYDRGLREPLPLFVNTSAAYAAAAWEGQDPVRAAEREWLTDWTFDREDRDLEHQLVLGGVRTLGELLAIAPGPDEAGPGWDVADTSRLGRLARRLWNPLLEREDRWAR
ncbi:MAG TPA: exodeoxyribonuclease V subunit gamma [Solirubrobacteraceae bacterium]